MDGTRGPLSGQRAADEAYLSTFASRVGWVVLQAVLVGGLVSCGVLTVESGLVPRISDKLFEPGASELLVGEADQPLVHSLRQYEHRVAATDLLAEDFE